MILVYTTASEKYRCFLFGLEYGKTCSFFIWVFARIVEVFLDSCSILLNPLQFSKVMKSVNNFPNHHSYNKTKKVKFIALNDLY